MNRSSRVLAGVVLVAVLSTHWYRLNMSPSTPYGLYRLLAVPSPLLRGTLVVLPVPAVMRPWWRSWWIPLMKPVAAVAGDEVCVNEGMLWIAGMSYGPVYTAAHGKHLPHIEGCQVVAAGTVFLASQAPRSLDSRYWGAVSVQSLTAQAVPLVTWR